MPKKRSRYSTNLAADWTFPMPLAEEEPSPKESLSDEDKSQRPDHASNARPASPLALTHSMKKVNRYKTVLPSSWIDPHSSLSDADESEPTQVIESQVQSNVHSDHYGYIKYAERPRRLDVEASISAAANGRYTPPPAPTHERVHFPFQDVDRRYGASTNPPLYMTDRRVRDSSLRRSSQTRLLQDRSTERSSQLRDHQATHFPVDAHETHTHYSAISPPVSVGQQSSDATTSPFHGRDLPANGPSVSPTYSTF